MNQRNTIFFIWLSLLFYSCIVLTIWQLNDWAGWMLMAVVLLSIAFRGNQFLKGFSFTTIIWRSEHCHVLSAIFQDNW